MSNVEKYASLKNTKFGRKMIIIAGFVTIAIISTWILYPIRNWKSNDVAIRYVRNNEIIKSEIGEITKIIGFGLLDLNLPTRSEEIARKLRTGESLANINTSKAKDNSNSVLISDDYGSWHSAKVIGSKKTIEVKLYVRRKEFGDFSQIYYTINEAKYLDETGNWQDIPVGWLENYFLLFK